MSLEKFVSFIDRSPTVYHAAKEIAARLAEADFTPLAEGEKWTLEPGDFNILVGNSSEDINLKKTIKM